MAEFYESNGKKQSKNSSSENNSESSVILNLDSESNRKDLKNNSEINKYVETGTNTLSNGKLTVAMTERPNSALNPTVRCEILMQKGTYFDIQQNCIDLD